MTTSTPSRSPNHKPNMNPYATPISAPPRSGNFSFDTSLFSMDASGSPALSQPFQSAIPAVNPSSGNKRPCSPSLHPHDRPPGHSPAPSAISPQSSTTSNNNHYSHTMNNPFSTMRGPPSNYSPNPSFFDPGSGSFDLGSVGSPSINDGFAEHTTPDFEEVEMPPLAQDDVYEIDNGMSAYSTPARGGGGRYPPSPRATASPGPKEFMITGGQVMGDVQIKVEQFTPTHSTAGNAMQMHPTPLSQNTNSSSSSLGAAAAAAAATESSTVKRGEDGSWRGGYDPTMRAALRLGEDAELPYSLKEETLNQLREFKNAEIEDWLKRNTLTGDAKDGRQGGLTVKAPKRGRAKSFSDFRMKSGPPKIVEDATVLVKPGESSAGNVTGVLVIEDDDEDRLEGAYDYEDDDSSVASSFNEGSLDDVLDDDESMNTSEAPPTEEDLKKEAEEEQKRLERDPAFFPNPRQFYSAHPWNDTVAPITRGASIAMKNQPNTANAAIRQFQTYAENIETASRVATFGSQMSKSRRLSAGDADRLLQDGGLLKRLSFGRDKDKEKERSGHQRRPSLWGNIVNRGLKRGLSNAADKQPGEKEKEGENVSKMGGDAGATSSNRKRGDSAASSIVSATSFGPLKRGTSWTKAGSLKVDTTVTNVHSAFAQMAGISAGVGQSSAHTASTGKPSSPTPPEKRGTGLSVGSGVIKAVRRARSKSELATGSKLTKNKPVFGIVSILGQYGGPPALPIKSPVGSSSSAGENPLKPRFTFGEETRKRGIAAANQQLLSPHDAHRHDGYDDDDDDDMDEAAPQATGEPPAGGKPEKLDITPNAEGFASHVRQKAPQLPPKLVDRIVYEQGKRYKKLVDHRQKHLAAIKNGGKCGNAGKCRGEVGAIGAGGQDGDNGHRRNVSTGSYEGEAYSSDETVGDHSPTEGKVAATQFPPGVPQPPVSRLPAEFECPICFKVKKFTKPSDWTKHVHEDVHPFTCTFLDCTEPKSFKRKADWVRHENERHRHLEWWTCNIPDCTHTCYRKDNFVQHLVREHKMAEPKLKAQKAAAKAAGKGGAAKKGKNKAVVGVDGAPTQDDFNKVWQIVDDCHKVTTRHPTEERCRFCSSVCPTWKKLTVHLARHMETISLPVLDLISDTAVVPPSAKASSGKAAASSNASVAPVAPMPKVQPAAPAQLSNDMDIDSAGGVPQQQQSADGEYEEDVLPQYTGGNTSYNVNQAHHIQQTPPRSSPHIPQDHQFNIHTPPNVPRYPVNGGSRVQVMTPAGLGFSPEQSIHAIHNVHPGLHPTLGQPFEYPGGHEMYPSPASATAPRATSVNGGYSPSPTYSHRQLQHSPAQRMIPMLPGQQQHLQVQQQQQQYFAYGHTSGQVSGNIGLVGQVHNEAVTTAHNLIENHGQFGFYTRPQEIPMGIMEVTMAPMDPNDDFFIG